MSDSTCVRVRVSIIRFSSRAILERKNRKKDAAGDVEMADVRTVDFADPVT